jgi:hypothetical protein
VLVYANDALKICDPRRGDTSWMLPKSIDLFSVDVYSSGGLAEVAAVKAAVQTCILPRLSSPHQSLILVPGVFGNSGLPLGQGGCKGLNKYGHPAYAQNETVTMLDLLFEWAQTESRIAGFCPWHYNDRCSVATPPVKCHDAPPPCDMDRGAISMPLVKAKLEQIGKAIISGDWRRRKSSRGWNNDIVFESPPLKSDDRSSPSPTMVEHPIASALPPLYLDGDWTATNTGGPQARQPPLPATVPGDILTDLQRAGRVADPYWNMTWRTPDFIAAWNNGTWAYTKKFMLPASWLLRGAGSINHFTLVFDGIRMGAMVSLNGIALGNATNQFIRYVFDAGTALKPGAQNVLEVKFGADLGIDCGGRWTYSNSIDWSPSMLTLDNASRRATFGFAIWKSVYVVSIPHGGAAISQLAPQTFYRSGHPTTRLGDNEHKGFDVKASVELLAPEGGGGVLSVVGGWPGAVAVSKHVLLVKGNNTVVVAIPAAQTLGVRLWHPHGHGEQPRYSITATYAPSGGAAGQSATTERLMGFRHAVLITMNDTDGQAVADAPNQNGTGQFTMFFRVNGAAVYARGANKIPMDLMEGRMTATAHHRLVQSAVEGNFNTLRVWGGGVWEPRAFFDACDALGVLVYQDAMETFGEVGFEPTIHADQLQTELGYQVSRLAHHPSVVLYSGCNECIYHDGGGQYETLVTTRIAAIDPSRIIWPHSPAPDGWSSGVDRLTMRPKLGQQLVAGVKPAGIGRPTNYPFALEGHGPYVTIDYTGNQSHFVQTVMPVQGLIEVHIANSFPFEHPVAMRSWTGPQYEGWYQSEFGCVSWPSFESASPSMPPGQWSLSSSVAHSRNWNPAGVIHAMFGQNATSDMATAGEQAFKRQLYQSQVGQALVLKTEIESWRSTNNFGTTFWMFNELWATGGWGSVEYGSVGVAGQLEGGRWKPLHYVLKASTFADQMSTCTDAGSCYVTNDSPFEFKGTVSVRLLNVMTGKKIKLVEKQVSLQAGAGITEWFCPEAIEGAAPHKEAVIYATVHDAIPGGGNAAANFSIVHGQLNSTTCADACTANSKCVGFTEPNAAGYRCWFYDYVPKQLEKSGADYRQKSSLPLPPVGRPVPPSPPPPPPPQPRPAPPPGPPGIPPPAQLSCTMWNRTAGWREVDCDANGTNCVLVIEVSNSSGARESLNILPFVSPKQMHLPKATVAVSVEDTAGGIDRVPITLKASATAMFVVLTSAAPGRFSENMVLIEGGQSKVITFMSWASDALNSTGLALLKSSLRVEHLADNVFPPPLSLKTDEHHTEKVIIHAARPTVALASAALGGIGIEDANHQLYGGLYSQMVFGESFEEPPGPDGASGSAPWRVYAGPGCFGTSQGPTWTTVRGHPSVLMPSSPGAFTGNQSQQLPPGSAIANSGLLGAGMSFARGRGYEGVLYVRGPGQARLSISSTVGGVAVAEFVVDKHWGSDWARVAFTLLPNRSSSCPLGPASTNHTAVCDGCADGCVSSPELGLRCIACTGALQLSVDAGSAAALEVDAVFLSPGPWGLYKGALPARADVAQLMERRGAGGMRPGALRLGGSMVLCEGYRWKNFRGPREQRQPYAGVWYRYDSGGFKIFEFLDLCEATGAAACVVTLNLNEDVADLEDLVEYAYGSTASAWGAQRVRDGRVQPYRPFVVEIGNENAMNYTGSEATPCRDGCHNFTGRWVERALAMDAKAHTLGLNLTFVVGFDVLPGTSCSAAAVQQSKASIIALANQASSLGARALWDCHTGGDSPAAGNVTAAALNELQQVLRAAGSAMRAAVLEENGGSHNMLRMLGHTTQNHALRRLGEFVVVNTAATGLQPLGRNSNGWDQGSIYFTPDSAWLAPPAVANRMIAVAAFREVLEVEAEFWRSGLDIVASRSVDGKQLGILVANPTNVSVQTVLAVEGWWPQSDSVLVEALSAPVPTAVRVNSSSATTTLGTLASSGWTFPPYSYTTFRSPPPVGAASDGHLQFKTDDADAVAEVQWWIEPPTAKVLLNASIPASVGASGQDRLDIAMMRGECEHRQVVVCAPAGADLVNITLVADSGSSIGSWDFKQVGYVNCRTCTNYRGSGGGWRPDVLLESDEGVVVPLVPAGSSQPIWTTLCSDAAAAPGNFSGQLLLHGQTSARSAPNIAPAPFEIKVNVSVEVWDIEMPPLGAPGSMATSFCFWGDAHTGKGGLASYYPGQYSSGTALQSTFYRFLAERRVPADEIYTGTPRPVNEMLELAREGVKEMTLLDANCACINGSCPCVRNATLSEEYIGAILAILDAAISEYNETAPHLIQQRLLRVYAFDEAAPAEGTAMRQLYGRIEERWPWLRKMVTVGWTIPPTMPLDTWVLAVTPCLLTALFL